MKTLKKMMIKMENPLVVGLLTLESLIMIKLTQRKALAHPIFPKLRKTKLIFQKTTKLVKLKTFKMQNQQTRNI